MAWYRTGTVTVTNGSKNVVGVDTLWLTQASVGDIFTLAGDVLYEIESITDDTHLALKTAYVGTTGAAQAYSIIRNFTSTTTSVLAQKLADMLTKWHLTLDELLSWLTATGTVPLTNPATGTSVQVKTPTQMQSEWIGSLTKSVAGGVNVTLTVAEAGNAVIKLTGALTANIAVIVPTVQTHLILLENATTGAFSLTVRTAAGSGVVVAQGARAGLFCDGTNVVAAFTALPGLAASAVAVTPTGNLASTTVQAALAELDSEKAAATNPTTSGTMIHNGNVVVGTMPGGAATYRGDVTINQGGSDSASNGGLELKVDSSGNGYGSRIKNVFNGTSAYDLVFQSRANSAAWSNMFVITHLGNVLAVSPTGGLGYGAGAGGTVIQPTSKSTAVTINKPSGTITTHPESLAAGASVQFLVYNIVVKQHDGIILTVNNAAQGNNMRVKPWYTGDGYFWVDLKNDSGAAQALAVDIEFQILRGATT